MLSDKLQFLLLGLTISLSACCQDSAGLKVEKPVFQRRQIVLNFEKVAPGVEFCEANTPDTSILGDSKFTILKLDPKFLDFELITASNRDRKPLPVDQWADTLGADIVFNAGMYDLARPLTSRGYLQNGPHMNQSAVKEGWNSVIALNPFDRSRHDLGIYDLQATPIAGLKKNYGCLAQGLRMLDANGNPTLWKKAPMSCSMLLAAEDDNHNVYLIFCRSPFTHNTVIGYLKEFPVPLKNAIYLEGGPETSLYVHIGEFCLQKVGSYVSRTYPTDANTSFWALPNVIAVRLKS